VPVRGLVLWAPLIERVRELSSTDGQHFSEAIRVFRDSAMKPGWPRPMGGERAADGPDASVALGNQKTGRLRDVA
jgi:hypothetical protein